MPTLTRAAATIAYADTGAPPDRPDAPTVVFGHGLLFSGWMFHHQVAALRSSYRCVTVDWRGQGDSPATGSGYDMDTLAEDAVALLEHLDDGPVHWVGLSMGGMVGMRVAARRPDLVRSLVLLDTSADRETRRARVEDRVLAQVYRFVGIGPVRSQVEKVMFGPAFRTSPEGRAVIDTWVEMLGRSDRAGVARAVHGVLTRPAVASELVRIEAPTMVATGEHDKPTPPDRGRRIAAAVVGARFQLIPGTGHSSSLEQPAAVTALVREFLDAH